MRSRQIDRLSSENTNCVGIFRRQRIVRQVLVKIEGWHVCEPTVPVEITHGSQRRDLVGALDDCWTKAEAILYRHPEAFHERSGVEAETLLARDQRIAMMGILHLKSPHVL